ncbi:hypothetical protein RRG08_051268 [Elysia crispata]|uniref:Uncharacterized protein n=1 Tax=Elysia crispata TaxID=231223 RepID=A0AAE0Z1Z8_9GAST|nr:hypothetical protein RRG08_051268 [Elysia crispata]
MRLSSSRYSPLYLGLVARLVWEVRGLRPDAIIEAIRNAETFFWEELGMGRGCPNDTYLMQEESCEECPSGKYGVNCNESCSAHCAGTNNACSHINGSCVEGCDPGYTGETCNQECPSGKYGVNCNKRCSAHCAGTANACSHINGSCVEGCDPGYTGETCNQECPSGKYGVNCNKSCSAHCAGTNNACSHINGSCAEGCFPGYTGETCEKRKYAERSS